MKFGKTILFFAAIVLSVTCGYLIGQQNNDSVNAQKRRISSSNIFELLKKINAEEVKEKIRDRFIYVGSDEKKFYGVIREVDEPPTEDSMFKASDKLTIYDSSGKSVYEKKDHAINGVELERFLRPDSREILFSTNGGGTDWFLNILSYKNGKFVEIPDDNDFQYRGGYFTIPQYRTGMQSPYFKPSQLIVIQQQGGGDEDPTASVFRTKDNKFQKVGEIRMQELGDFIEKQIARKN
jgi:hypothetical protein